MPTKTRRAHQLARVFDCRALAHLCQWACSPAGQASDPVLLCLIQELSSRPRYPSPRDRDCSSDTIRCPGAGRRGRKTNHVEQVQLLVSSLNFAVGIDEQLGVEHRLVVAGGLSSSVDRSGRQQSGDNARSIRHKWGADDFVDPHAHPDTPTLRLRTHRAHERALVKPSGQREHLRCGRDEVRGLGEAHELQQPV
jgi:hypothetical protein